MPRIVIIGASGSGKTTLARGVSQTLGIPHFELDELHWGPGWTPFPDFVQRVERAVALPDWVIDGGYGQVRPQLWGRADTIVWLNYACRLVFMRVFRRTMVRGLRGDRLWNDNRERLWKQFLTNDSLLLWVVQTWRKYRRDVPRHFASAKWAHARRITLCTPAAADRWLASLGDRLPQPTTPTPDCTAEPPGVNAE